MKKLISVLLVAFFMLSTLPMTAFAWGKADTAGIGTGATLNRSSSKEHAPASASLSNIKVKLTDYSGDFSRGFWFKYTINGIEYRSDEVGTSFNRIAVKNMTAEEKKHVLEALYAVPNIRWNQLGKAYSQELTDWYNEVTGWKNAAQVLSDRLAAKNFPEYQKRFSDDGVGYFKTNFEPDFYKYRDSSGYVSAVDEELINYFRASELYQQEQLVFSWAVAAYRGMVAANNLRTQVAIQSLSGDLIQLIVDRALVPNITPAGAGGITTSISTTIFDYVNSIEGYTDDLVEIAVGKRVRADQASKIIADMTATIDMNERIIRECCQEAHRLQAEIDEKFTELHEKLTSKMESCNEERQLRSKDVAATVATFFKPDSSVINKYEQYTKSIEDCHREDFESEGEYLEEYQRRYNARDDYFNSVQGEVRRNTHALYKKYFGTDEFGSYTEQSIIGKYLADDPRAKFDNARKGGAREYYGIDVLKSTPETVAEAEASFETYKEAAAKFTDAVKPYLQYAKTTGTAALNELAPITAKVAALEQISPGTNYRSEVYTCLDHLGNFAGLNAFYVGHSELSGNLNSKHLYNYDKEKTLEYIPLYQEANDYQKRKWEKYSGSVSGQKNKYKSAVSGYEQAWADYNNAKNARSELLNNLPDYISQQVVYKNQGEWVLYTSENSPLGKMFEGDNATGTLQDAQRIAGETERLFTQYSQLTAKINVSANNIAASEICAGDMFSDLGNCFYADNKALSSGIIDWNEVYDKYHSGKRNNSRGDSSGDSDSGIEPGAYDQERLQQLEFVRNDFNGRNHAHRKLMEYYFDLLDNFSVYAVPTTLTEDERLTDHYSTMRAWILYQTHEGTRNMYSYAAKVMGPVINGEPDPLDFILPLIDTIDAIRNGKSVPVDTNGDGVITIEDFVLTHEESAGDIDGDGEITMTDVVDIQKFIAHLSNFTNDQEKLADVSGDGKVTMEDVVLIQKHIAKLITEFPANT